jgi:hypothetical protein
MITDYIGKNWTSEIEKTFCNREFPWYYVDNVTHEQNDTNIYGFYHGIYVDGKILSNTYGLLMPILYEFCDKHSIAFKNIMRVRAGLLTLSGVPGHHQPHVDYEIPHKTLIYYVNDSDGETYFFNNKKEVINKVEPKKGKCVLFDGNIYHASSSPTKHNRRIVINYNFV